MRIIIEAGPKENVFIMATSINRMIRESGYQTVTNFEDSTKTDKKLTKDLVRAAHKSSHPVTVEINKIDSDFDYGQYLDDDPELGKIIKGTWVSVSQIVNLVEEGESFEDILHHYPELNHQDIRVCLSYADALSDCVSAG